MADDCLPWPLDPHCLPDDWNPAELTEAQQAAVDQARELLVGWSGGWYGQCQRTVRPCGPVDGPCSGPCGCAPVCRVHLPAPATGIVAVTVDGVALAADAVRIDGHTWMVRQDGGPCFPGCQDLSRPLGEPGTWGVTYLYGWPPPRMASSALTVLALDIFRQCEDGRCLPPSGTTRIVRTGVTIELDPKDYRNRLPIVGRWLDVANPDRRRSPLMPWSPDLPVTTSTTWTAAP